MKILRDVVLAAAAVLLAGCGGGKLIGSVAGGECQVMERPEYEVRGVAAYDQRWINRTVEGGVGACKWKRPSARPPEIDRAPVVRPATPAKRPGLIQRVKARIAPQAWPAAPTAPVVAVPPPAVAEPASPPPCSRLDKLLHRCGVRTVYPR